jgi:hypothetical protein
MTQEDDELKLILATVLPDDTPPFHDDPTEFPDQTPETDETDDEIVDDPDDVILDDDGD